MREILFRGKRKDNGEWIYGSLVLCPEDVEVVTIVVFDEEKNGFICGKYVEVDLNTIGQYTGLNDKNGKKIFEGDVVKTSHYNGVIEWCDFDASFEVRCEGVIVTRNTLAGHVMLEVIGNIHDNPELLEVEK